MRTINGLSIFEYMKYKVEDDKILEVVKEEILELEDSINYQSKELELALEQVMFAKYTRSHTTSST